MPLIENHLTIVPMQWAALPELYETAPLDDSDHACMIELRDVLARHGKLGRFALHLAHRHFDMDPGEVLIERSDPDGRSQHITVGQMQDAADAVPTTWMLDQAWQAGAGVYCVCQAAPYQEACVRHGKSNSPGEAAQKEESVKQRRISRDKAKYERGGPVAGHDPDERER